jgi:hypothetical protein
LSAATWRHGRRVGDRDTIDAEPRLLAVVRWALRELGGPMPSSKAMDELLDMRGRRHFHGVDEESLN